MKRDEEATGKRRGFLKMAAMSGPAAVAAVATARTGQAGALPVDPRSERMQDTAHTRAYFDSARF